MIAQSTVEDYLQRLASREATPGGGAAGGLHLAQGAALLSMVARFTNGKKYVHVQERAEDIAQQADQLRARSVTLAEQDAVVFAQVISAYQLPREDERQRSLRAQEIEQATIRAAQPQLEALQIGTQVIELAAELVRFGNRMVLSDVAAAADAARAGLGTAVVTMEINARSLATTDVVESLAQAVVQAEAVMAQADEVSAEVRKVLAA
ncbi:cyclodeaminase/cyclohydrolase family protein [Glutamicibacter sp. NPDC087344]|uniref:cyclodeaminase/cyclohydrolase family protein n=1 Tax=Glutamicibacter sp. NPDC087344 TaxID=3363994 RepID=UPI003828D8E4